MSVFYKIAYRIGLKPWEEAASHPPAVRHVHELFDREEREREAPLGRALDLGCGGGHWTVELDRRGWQVVGIDIVPRAIEEARERARREGADVRFVEGDATALRAAGVGEGFSLVWDFGTVHGLTQPQREQVGREVTAVTAPDATILMLAWKPGKRGPLPRGASREEIEAAYADWQIVADEPFDASGLPRPLRGVDPHAYRLRRRT